MRSMYSLKVRTEEGASTQGWCSVRLALAALAALFTIGYLTAERSGTYRRSRIFRFWSATEERANPSNDGHSGRALTRGL